LKTGTPLEAGLWRRRLSSVNGRTILVFLEHHRDIAIGAEADAIVVDAFDEFEGDEVMMAFVAGAAVLLGQLDAVALDAIDRADMKAVGADNLGMFSDLCSINHRLSLFAVPDNVPDRKKDAQGFEKSGPVFSG
jgi:hypothetical protein